MFKKLKLLLHFHFLLQAQLSAKKSVLKIETFNSFPLFIKQLKCQQKLPVFENGNFLFTFSFQKQLAFTFFYLQAQIKLTASFFQCSLKFQRIFK